MVGQDSHGGHCMDGEANQKPHTKTSTMGFVGKGASTALHLSEPPEINFQVQAPPPGEVPQAKAPVVDVKVYPEIKLEPYINVNVPPNPEPKFILNPEFKLEPKISPVILLPKEFFYMLGAICAGQLALGALFLWRFW